MKHREDKRVHDASLQMMMVTLIFAFYSSFNTEPIIPSLQLCKYSLIRLAKPPKKVNISEWRPSSILLYLREKNTSKWNKLITMMFNTASNTGRSSFSSLIDKAEVFRNVSRNKLAKQNSQHQEVSSSVKILWTKQLVSRYVYVQFFCLGKTLAKHERMWNLQSIVLGYRVNSASFPSRPMKVPQVTNRWDGIVFLL